MLYFEGSWSIKDATTVGNAGVQIFVATYTSTTGNYNSRDVEITVTVARKSIDVPTIPTNKDISYVKCVVLKPQMAVSDRYIRVSGEGIDVTLKLSKSFKDKMSVTLISDKMEKGQYYASIGTYEGEFDEIFKNGIELSDTYAQKLTVQ